jgi:dTDP-4-dehydrorhamnose reductase
MMSGKKIFVTGSNGQLGSELKDLAASFPDYNMIFFGREAFPINNKELARHLWQEHHPSYLINCAAYTAVDKAETERETAMDINGTAVGDLASLCRENGTRMIHISTDYVFNGEATTPLKETDEVDPVNFYGASKLKGEELALQHDPTVIIIRTSWVYSFYGKNFVKTMMRLMNEKESIGVVNDQSGAPTYAADLAEAIMQIIASGKWEPGIYHYSNKAAITWFDFAVGIKNQLGSKCIVNPISTNQFPTPAKRPAYSVMDLSKIEQTFPIKIKDWKESLAACINKLSAP